MIIELTFPAKSPTMTEGTLVAWKVKKGDVIKRDQVIAEIQSDKAVIEWESPESGTVAEILIPAGTQAPVNAVAALLTTKGEDITAALAKAKKTNAALSQPTTVVVAATAAAQPVLPSSSPGPSTGKRVSPVAARFAAQHKLDLSRVTGTGPDGRIVLRDVEQAANTGAAAIGVASKAEKPRLAVVRPDRATSEVAMSPTRLVIGKRLLEAKTQIPHFYVTESIDAGPLSAVREQVNLLEGIKVTVNDLIVRAAALALRVHPKLNATLHGTSIRQHDSADISVAVAVADGLITPIVNRAHAKTVRQIGDEVRVLAKKAVDGKLKPEEFQGGSFTISNLGMFGISEFTAIINPPQVAILAVAGIKDEPVVRGGQILPGKVMRLTLSADHRAVDGADAAAFMKTLRELLESPATLLI